ncbi:MAG: neprosin family prolyl endopeptidase [Bacteroidota bacterium]
MNYDYEDGNPSEEMKQYFAHRAEKKRVVKTTRTPGGQVLDWIPRESQHTGGKIATPPPVTGQNIEAKDSAIKLAGFELHDNGIERGPEGTVPVLRKNIAAIKTNKNLQQYLSKKGRDGRFLVKKNDHGGPKNPESMPPNPTGYLHATSAEIATCYGCEGFLNVWTPILEDSQGDGHSIMQTGMQNYDNPKLQSLEAGWTVDHSLNGDLQPHIFTYYTTNGYESGGDNVGGYNTDVDGWVQYDANVYPGALINGSSTLGGEQLGISMKFQLWQGNWWFQVQGIWLGYYPANLFPGNGNGGTGLGNHASWVAFWGEVYSDLRPETLTTIEMGSGYKAEEGWTYACFQNNLLIQTGTDGSMSNHNGSTSAEDPDLYDIISMMNSGGGWGSYFYAGGTRRRRHFTIPQKLTAEAVLILFGIINDGSGAYIDAQGHIHIVGPGDPGPLAVKLLNLLASYKMAQRVGGREGEAMQKLALLSSLGVIEKEIQKLGEHKIEFDAQQQ